MQKYKIVPLPSARHTPVVSTADLAVDGGVHSVFDQPGECRIGVQSDVFLVGSSHVTTGGVEISQKHHILPTHTHTHSVYK